MSSVRIPTCKGHLPGDAAVDSACATAATDGRGRRPM